MSATSDTWPGWAGAESPRPLQTIIATAARRGVYPVADDTERDGDLMTFLSTRGLAAPSADDPLYVHNKANTLGRNLQFTIDGTNWITVDARESGAVDLSSYLTGGATGSFFGSIRGGTVELYGSISGTFPSGASTTDFFAGVPEEFRPAGATRLGSASAGGYAGALVARADGTGAIWQRSGTSWSTALFSNVFHRN